MKALIARLKRTPHPAFIQMDADEQSDNPWPVILIGLTAAASNFALLLDYIG